MASGLRRSPSSSCRRSSLAVRPSTKSRPFTFRLLTRMVCSPATSLVPSSLSNQRRRHPSSVASAVALASTATAIRMRPRMARPLAVACATPATGFVQATVRAPMRRPARATPASFATAISTIKTAIHSRAARAGVARSPVWTTVRVGPPPSATLWVPRADSAIRPAVPEVFAMTDSLAREIPALRAGSRVVRAAATRRAEQA